VRSMLTALGLAENEERLYRILVTLPGPVTTADLAARAGLPAATVSALLGPLTARGLVLIESGEYPAGPDVPGGPPQGDVVAPARYPAGPDVPGGPLQGDVVAPARYPAGPDVPGGPLQGDVVAPARYAVAPPAVALGALLRQQRDDLRSAESELVALAEAHRLATIGRTAGDVIEVITGTDAVRQRFAQVQHAARVEVRSMVVPNLTVVPPGENSAEPVSMARGVRYRVIIDRSFLEMPGGNKIIAEAIEEGEEVRFVDRVPIKMIIADRELGMLPLAGLTDHAVAGSLSLSARTVQRRIRHLMNLACVTTRVQLGFHAARKDWA